MALHVSPPFSYQKRICYNWNRKFLDSNFMPLVLFYQIIRTIMLHCTILSTSLPTFLSLQLVLQPPLYLCFISLFPYFICISFIISSLPLILHHFFSLILFSLIPTLSCSLSLIPQILLLIIPHLFFYSFT